MAVMEISVVPLGTSSPSVSGFVAGAVKVARDSGLSVTLTPMGTVVTGAVDELLALAAKMHKSALSGGVQRVVTSIKIDDRTDKELDPEGKIASVEKKLQS